jgi:hypothetical protein
VLAFAGVIVLVVADFPTLAFADFVVFVAMPAVECIREPSRGGRRFIAARDQRQQPPNTAPNTPRLDVPARRGIA